MRNLYLSALSCLLLLTVVSCSKDKTTSPSNANAAINNIDADSIAGTYQVRIYFNSETIGDDKPNKMVDTTLYQNITITALSKTVLGIEEFTTIGGNDTLISNSQMSTSGEEAYTFQSRYWNATMTYYPKQKALYITASGNRDQTTTFLTYQGARIK